MNFVVTSQAVRVCPVKIRAMFATRETTAFQSCTNGDPPQSKQAQNSRSPCRTVHDHRFGAYAGTHTLNRSIASILEIIFRRAPGMLDSTPGTADCARTQAKNSLHNPECYAELQKSTSSPCSPPCRVLEALRTRHGG